MKTNHNLGQRAYFEGTLKRTMIPSDTPYNQRHVEEVLRFSDYRVGERVLEIGCGMGRHTLLLAQMGVQVEGLDLSPILLERLQEYSAGQYSIPLHCADILDPPQELYGRFDLVIGFFTLHHLFDIPGSFAGMVKFLHSDGRIVFLEPNPYSPLFHLQIWFSPRMSYKGERRLLDMRSKIIKTAMESAGFSRFQVKRFGFFPPFITNRPGGHEIERLLEGIPIWRPLLPFQLFRGQLD